MAAKLMILFCLALFLASPVFGQNKPSIDLDWYGYFKLDAAYDQNQTSHGNFAMYVKNNAEKDEQFNMTHKQTRFGVKASSNGYDNVKLGGQLEFDMYAGGGTENKALLLLR
ncbi:MAG: hypothetical protein GY865_11930, partial [candidate division Zixibacteria bacterium]|nr:hypothetical protein [candidate division Zixibacteria bacterium]